jgi:hypothetical protein
MFDGSTHWLVDGFHRYLALKAVGKSGYACEIHQGTQEDAILMATSVNCAHGLQRTNATKRKSVETALALPKTAGWTNQQIARHCGVSDKFVAAVRDPEVKIKQAEAVQRHFEKKAQASIKSNLAPNLQPDVSIKSTEDDFAPSEEEIRAAEKAHEEFLAFMQEAFDGDDVLAETAKKLEQTQLELHHLRISYNGLVNTNTELTKMVKFLQRKLDRVNRAPANQSSFNVAVKPAACAPH